MSARDFSWGFCTSGWLSRWGFVREGGGVPGEFLSGHRAADHASFLANRFLSSDTTIARCVVLRANKSSTNGSCLPLCLPHFGARSHVGYSLRCSLSHRRLASNNSADSESYTRWCKAIYIPKLQLDKSSQTATVTLHWTLKSRTVTLQNSIFHNL